jgi:hypothetical protein
MKSPLFLKLLAGAVIMGAPVPAFADGGHGHGHGLRADPFVFNARANDPNQCGNPYPRGANIVTSAWLDGMGLPDDGTANSQNPFPAGAGPSPRDPHTGLLLNKNGPTGECASAGAEIKGWRKRTPLTELGFDYRFGGHCGNGAPRFNVRTTAGQRYFVGCAFGTHTPAPQDPEWRRVRFAQTDFFNAATGLQDFTFGTQVDSITIVYDEGTDTPSVSDPNGVGLAVLDNIDINGKLITSGRGIEPDHDHGHGHDHDDDDDD